MANPTPLTREDLEERHPGLLSMLGKEPDGTIAKRFKISRQRVGQIRRKLDIPATGSTSTISKGAPLRSRVLHWMRELWEGTSAALAEALGTSAPVMSGWCSGDRVPTWETLIAAAGLLGLELLLGPAHITVLERGRGGKELRRFEGATC